MPLPIVLRACFGVSLTLRQDDRERERDEDVLKRLFVETTKASNPMVPATRTTLVTFLTRRKWQTGNE